MVCARSDDHALVRGIVQIANGMGTCTGAGLIEFLPSMVLTLYGNDHGGHGRAEHRRSISEILRIMK
jgi:hypothetical protein